MIEKSFKDFYEIPIIQRVVSGLIKRNCGRLKDSKEPVIEQIGESLDVPTGNYSINLLDIKIHNEYTFQQQNKKPSAKSIYEHFFKHCYGKYKNTLENYEKQLKQSGQPGWFIEPQGGNKTKNKRYFTLSNGAFVYRDLNVIDLMVRAVRLVLDCGDDLSKYSFVYEIQQNEENIEQNNYQEIKGAKETVNTDLKIDKIEHIKNYISSNGFSYDNNLIENFYLSLKSKPFVILAGTSGTGKTRLVRLFAEAIGAEYKLVPVRPDWADSTDLFGHASLNGKFIPGAIIDFIKEAENNLTKPYFLCLDEMNLARVEYYLSDILSIIETRNKTNDGSIISDPLIPLNYYGEDDNARINYGEIRLPENLYIVGTVNMDETTFPFSRKVLDRANTIEFSNVCLDPFSNFIKSIQSVNSKESYQLNPLNMDNSFMKAEFALFKDCLDSVSNNQNKEDLIKAVVSELESINKILQQSNAHVGYRVRDEIVFYMLNNYNYYNKSSSSSTSEGLLSKNTALDYQIMQKILPRIQGSGISVKRMLCDLFAHCFENTQLEQTETDNTGDKLIGIANDILKNNPDNCKYPESAKKIAFMVKRFDEDGFTSFWL